MSKAEEAVWSVVSAIKSNPELPKANAVALVEEIYPDEGDWRLQLYIDALYNSGAILKNDYSSLRAKILELSKDDIVRIKDTIISIANHLLDKIQKIEHLQARKAELEELLAEGPPYKEEPDQETLDFWNAESMEVQDYMYCQSELEKVTNKLERLNGLENL